MISKEQVLNLTIMCSVIIIYSAVVVAKNDVRVSDIITLSMPDTDKRKELAALDPAPPTPDPCPECTPTPTPTPEGPINPTPPVPTVTPPDVMLQVYTYLE